MYGNKRLKWFYLQSRMLKLSKNLTYRLEAKGINGLFNTIKGLRFLNAQVAAFRQSGICFEEIGDISQHYISRPDPDLYSVNYC